MLKYSWVLLVFLLPPPNLAQPSPTSDPVTSSTCVVPPYAIHQEEVLFTENSSALLLAEGRCYLGCLSNATESKVGEYGGFYQVCNYVHNTCCMGRNINDSSFVGLILHCPGLVEES